MKTPAEMLGEMDEKLALYRVLSEESIPGWIVESCVGPLADGEGFLVYVINRVVWYAVRQYKIIGGRVVPGGKMKEAFTVAGAREIIDRDIFFHYRIANARENFMILPGVEA